MTYDKILMEHERIKEQIVSLEKQIILNQSKHF